MLVKAGVIDNHINYMEIYNLFHRLKIYLTI